MTEECSEVEYSRDEVEVPAAGEGVESPPEPTGGAAVTRIVSISEVGAAETASVISGSEVLGKGRRPLLASEAGSAAGGVRPPAVSPRAEGGREGGREGEREE